MNLTRPKVCGGGLSRQAIGRALGSDFLLMGTALNMLDTWLPVVSGLRERGLSGTVLFPYAFILERSAVDDTTLSIAEDVFDSVYVFSENRLNWFPSVASAWACFREKPSGEKGSKQALLKFRAKIRAAFSRIRKFDGRSEESLASQLVETISGRVLLYDVTNRTQDKMFHDYVDSQASLRGFRVFSLPHAPVPIMSGEDDLGEVPFGWTHVSHLNASAESHQPAKAGSRIAMGIPRHDSEWVGRLIARSRRLHSTPKQPYMVLFSHGGGDGYSFSDEKKFAVIERLGETLRKMNMRLVVKKHPTEHLSSGQNFTLSNAHPLHLIESANAVFVFLTSVVADALYFGKPIIQILEIASDLRESRTSRRTWAEAKGLAFTCDSFEELEIALSKLASGLSTLGTNLSPRYGDLLVPPDNLSLISIIESAVRAPSTSNTAPPSSHCFGDEHVLPREGPTRA